MVIEKQKIPDEALFATDIPDEGVSRRGLGLPIASILFLGLGLYRAWIEIVYVGSFSEFAIQQQGIRDTFDLSAVAIWAIFAIFAKKIGPLYNKRWPYISSALLLTLSTIATFMAGFNADIATMTTLPAAISAGVGIALLVLLWSEYFGSLNPIRVAVYYSASILVGALVIYIFKGFMSSYLATFTATLPILSALCVYVSFKTIRAENLPSTTWARFSFPWKPVLLMAIYSFAYGLRENTLYSTSGPHSSVGVIFAALIVLAGVIYQGKKFNFGVMYRIGMPCMIGAFLLIPSFGFPGDFLSNFCVSASYTAFSILVMIIFSNLSYRLGVSALWLFGIERAVRQVSMFGGRETSNAINDLIVGQYLNEITVNVIIILLVVVVTLMLISEKGHSSMWGMSFIPSDDAEADEEYTKRHAIGSICRSIAEKFGLTAREEEVLLLLAQKSTISEIERELFIAEGTAKAHVRHIYYKLDIHSRDELFELVESYG
ncbi:MAG: response regulator transcription factor [Actinobacteria bacterium]|nr:response regulator transcription factor [Actinomycetota bacterium]